MDTVKIAKEIFENLNWDGMEFVVYRDGETFTRQIGSFGEHEDEILVTINLSEYYWADIFKEWEIVDLDEISESLKEDFIDEVIMPYLEI